MYVEWTEKYRPKELSDVVGNRSAADALRKWAFSWNQGIPKKRAVILSGEPGTGKTSSAHALANEYGWGVIELNASDQRNADVIHKIATMGALGETFDDSGSFLRVREGGRKLIILDEADNLFGREDRGGIRAIGETIRSTKQPIILIVNDLYSLKRKASFVSTHCEIVKFTRIRAPSVKKVLIEIAKNEGVRVSPNAMQRISENANGDLRSAINDLDALSIGRTEITEGDVLTMGHRDVPESIFHALAVIFKTNNARRAASTTWDIDETPDHVILWVDENLPNAYHASDDLCRGYEALSRADLFLGRVHRRQNYGLWTYAGDMMTAGVALGKTRDYKGYKRYQFPVWLSKMSSSRSRRGIRKGIGRKLGSYLHQSTSNSVIDVFPYFQKMFKGDRGFRISAIDLLSLDEDEVAYILEDKANSRHVRHVMDEYRRFKEISYKKDLQKGAEKKETADKVKDDEKSVPEEVPKEEEKNDNKANQTNLFEF